MKKIFSCSLLLLAATGLSAQSSRSMPAYEVLSVNEQTGLPSFVVFAAGEHNLPGATAPESWFRKEWNAGNDFQLKQLSGQKDAAGNNHIRYAQYYKGIPVDGAIVNVHYQDGAPYALNGTFYPVFETAGTARLKEAEALTAALSGFPGATFAWQLPAQEAFLKKVSKDPQKSYYPKAEMVMLAEQVAGDEPHTVLHYAYCFDIYAISPFTRKMVYIDAATGKLLRSSEMIHDVERAGKAHTRYSGLQTILCDSTDDGVFILEETSRGLGVGTYNATKMYDGSYTIDNFEDADNDWNNVNPAQDEVATDIHWALEQTYDFYENKFGRSSVDDRGLPLIGLAHVDLPAMGMSPANAFWDGRFAFFGDGDDTMCSAMTSLDIIGHELSHGLTQYTAELSYSDESGALNESFSDIMGKSIEHTVLPASANWEMGKRVMIGGRPALRNMKDPNSRMHPKYYKGKYYYIGPDDAGGVHTNSGVQNYWYYLLCEGGSGVRESDGAPFEVNPIGWDKALAVAYANLSVYLTASSTYKDAAACAIAAAKSLYGSTSKEAYEVQMAWYAVGLATKPLPLVSVNEIPAAQSFTVSPNPTGGLVQLTPALPLVRASIKIVSITGQVLGTQQNVSGTVVPLDMSAYPAGMYIIEINNDGQLSRVKLSRF